ncbi:hypothetical protein D0Z00_001384 [Geotrichum galactomycetum]|uniref:Uncharacterized protein n=1 Tax=Geotrichum galactomycetum TaxID=27317 RepID=A0ACB6V797_9ASCO|nr:hypothetical protein D0Z00_001384 [Geotrichum candidum]
MNTLVGNDYIRGVSGGERKRVSIAEVCLNGSSLQCWDNSTRGLDSATALEFIRNLKNSSEISDAAIFVSLYQASQDAYDLFDKVTVLYEGHQIYFGPTKDAKQFFEDMGYYCPERQTTGDFLTSLTSSSERIAKPGMEEKVPRTADEFAKYWQSSTEFSKLINEIDQFNSENPVGSENLEKFKRLFECSSFVPRGGAYNALGLTNKICAVVGSVLGRSEVQGSDYIIGTFDYLPKHMWRNFGVIIAFTVLSAITYLGATEIFRAKKSKGEVLIFQKGRKHRRLLKFHHHNNDVESRGGSSDNTMEHPDTKAHVNIERQHGIFQWKDVCYDIKIKNEPRRLLDHVDGWVEPGTLTALMGASGAGKTTLLDVLANRVTMGVITGDMLVNGNPRENSFQRKTGYVQQQDVHLATSTVREALQFSALLRQPARIPDSEKLEYVEEVIKILEMEEYSDAVVGVPGEGLNVEQRKRLTIGVELAAKPELLLFLDEPTSGLDSQTAWSICSLMRKLANNGQAILCTIHQPSAMLFQEFDRLLFLQKGGQTVYFGDIGDNASILVNYFERNGSIPCPPSANPAEWMLKVIGAAPGSHTDIDWFQTWRNSPELAKLHADLDERASKLRGTIDEDPSLNQSFAASYPRQVVLVTKRVFQQYWRTPSYIWSKIGQCIASPLFVGFTYWKADNDIQGMQNQMFSVFVFLLIFAPLVEQILPNFVTQRALYEVRERPSKTYSWVAFMLSNIFAEFPWQTLVSALAFFCYYYPVGYYRNAGDEGYVDTV